MENKKVDKEILEKYRGYTWNMLPDDIKPLFEFGHQDGEYGDDYVICPYNDYSDWGWLAS